MDNFEAYAKKMKKMYADAFAVAEKMRRIGVKLLTWRRGTWLNRAALTTNPIQVARARLPQGPMRRSALKGKNFS